MGVVQAAVDGLLREAMLFAAVGLLIGGLDDLVVDLLFLIRRVWRGGRGKLSVAALAERGTAGRIVVFVPA